MTVVKNKLDQSQDVNLLIIGGDIDYSSYSKDSEMHKLKLLTTELGLENMVTFLGPQRQDQLPYFYSAAEACVLPSRYESFGMVALEARLNDLVKTKEDEIRFVEEAFEH